MEESLLENSQESEYNYKHEGLDDDYDEETDLKWRVWIESKKLWHIVGPSIFYRVASNTTNIVTQVFAGHLGDLELASISIANNVLVGFNFGLLLGMASALETLCGQAFGAKKHHLLGIYLQRCCIVLFLCSLLLLPLFIFATPILILLGQPNDVAAQAGLVSKWLIPLHFSFAFQFPIQRFLQSQLKTGVFIWVSLVALVFHVFVSWLFVVQLELGVVGAALALDVSWWILVFGMCGYIFSGKCGDCWEGFSLQAYVGLWDFLKLSAGSGVMLCLENWYYRILVLMTGILKDATIAIDALAICTSINSWEMMISLAYFAGTGVRVANELGAGKGKAAKFATLVSVGQSIVIGVFFSIIVVIFKGKLALIFSSNNQVADEVNNLAYLLAASVLLNSVQPVLSGVAVGSGWQTWVAYINIGCYYFVGLPTGILLFRVFNLGIGGLWGGMIFGGTALQTLILAIITLRRDWQIEALNATMHVEKWSVRTQNSRP